MSMSLGGTSRTLWQLELEVLEWHRQIMPNKRTASQQNRHDKYKPPESNQNVCGLQSFLEWHGLPAAALQPEGRPLTPNQERRQGKARACAILIYLDTWSYIVLHSSHMSRTSDP